MYDHSAFTGADGAEEFERLHPIQRKQVIREVARQKLSESRSGIPLKLDDADWLGMATMASILADDEVLGHHDDGLGALRESGVPVRADMPEAPTSSDPGWQASMHEAGVPLKRRTRSAEPRQLTPLAALVTCHVPIREAAASSAPALERPAHEVVADLDRAVPEQHPDRTAVDRLRARGAALTSDQQHEVAALAQTHAKVLADLPTATDEDGPVREASWERALADAGFTAYRGTLPEPTGPAEDPHETLAEMGIPLKPGAR